REMLEERRARYAHVLDLQLQAIARRQVAGGPRVLPVAPGFVGRVGLDQLIEQVAVGERVVEVEEEREPMRHGRPPGAWPQALSPTRRSPAGAAPRASARGRRRRGGRSFSAGEARAARS